MGLELNKIHIPGIREKMPLVISGPCSAETEEQVMETARKLSACGVQVFRAGIWKPRTKPGGFEGNGEKALPWLKQVKKETGMLVTTEVATPAHVEAALRMEVDILWIGARTSANPFAIQDLADCLTGVEIPVFVKNPVSPDIELWVGALERFNRAGIRQLGAIHRGFSSADQKIYRNMPLWHIPIELHRRYPMLPILCDPSHMGGRPELIAPLSQQALDMGFDGLMIESHVCPTCAWSDAKQQITPEVLHEILDHLVLREAVESTEILEGLRKQIDEMDDQLMDLLSKRMYISRQIAQYKKEQNMRIVQSQRYAEILDKRAEQGSRCKMDPDFVRRTFEAIHEESVRQQTDIFKS